jgi:hypothetical protein
VRGRDKLELPHIPIRHMHELVRDLDYWMELGHQAICPVCRTAAPLITLMPNPIRPDSTSSPSDDSEKIRLDDLIVWSEYLREVIARLE